MKQIRMTMAVLLMAGGLTMTGAVFAKPIDDVARVSVSKSDHKKVKLFTPSAVEVALIDANGTVLYKGDIRPAGNNLTSINLANLPDGHYYLTATNNDFWTSQGLTIRKDQVSVDAQNTSALVRPTLIPYAKNKFEITMPGTRTLNVAIYDRVNALVFSETYEKGNVHRFDLSKLPAGDYTFVVGPDFKQFTESVAVQH